VSLFRQISSLARHSAIYAVSTAMQRLPGFLLLPIYTNFHYIPTQDDFGDYVIVFTFIAFMNFFFLYGMDSAMMRYFFLGKSDRKTVFSTTFYILLLTSLISTTAVMFFSGNIAQFLLKSVDYQPLIRIAALILLFDTFGNLPYFILRAEEKSIQFTAYKSLRFTLELGFNILFVVILHKGVMGIFYTSLAAAIVNLLVMSPIIFRYLQPRLDVSLGREMLRFGLPLLPNGIAFMTIEMIDRILVPTFLNKAALASYGANYRFGAILLLLITAFRNAWQPFFLKIANQENARKIYASVLTYFVIGAGMIVLLVSYFIRDLLTFPFLGKYYILAETAYWDGISIIPIILLSYFFFGIYVILTPGFYIRKKTRYMIIFTGCGAAVNIAANLFLLPLLNSFWGAAWATLLSYLAMAVTIYIVANRIYPIAVEWGRISKIFAMIALLLGVYFYFQPGFIARIIIMLVMILYCIFGVLLNAERRMITTRLRGLFGR